MEVGLSAITLFLASASSPVVATTMDQEPVGRVEREAVAPSGVAAAAAFGESAGQVGGAADAGVQGAELPPCLLRGPLFWPARPSSEQAAPVLEFLLPAPLFLLSETSLWEGAASHSLTNHLAGSTADSGAALGSGGDSPASGLPEEEGRRVPQRPSLQ